MNRKSVAIGRPLVLNRWFRYAITGLLLATMFGLALDSMRRESVTVDEPLHLTAGYAFWSFDDYRLQESHGALPQRWFALPLLVSKVQFPSRDDDSWRHPGFLGVEVCRKFFFNSGNEPNAMVFRGRLMAIVVALLTAIAVYSWTARVFGPAAGLLACFFCALSPTMLAHGRLMTSDVTAALFFLMTVGCFWSLLRRFTYFRLASSAVCFGLLQVSKMSGGLAAGMALMMLLFRLALGRPWLVRLRGLGPCRVLSWRGKAGLAGAAALVHVAVALAIIWCFYGWQFKPSRDWNADRDSYTEPRESVVGSLGVSQSLFEALEHWKILPDAYLYGVAHTIKNAAERPAYLNGQYSLTGWWYYFPYCFLAKTPLTLLAFIGLGTGSLALRITRHRDRCRAALWVWLDKTSLIWSLVLLYGSVAVFSNLNIGHRHLLPIYPPLFMLAGAAAVWFAQAKRWLRGLLAIILILHIGTIVRIHPHYLAYFNALAGGPTKGYLHLSDSNVDWGQDLPLLAQWLGEHRNLTNPEQVYLGYFGFDLPARWGIQALALPVLGVSNPKFSSADPVLYRAGTYCLSATTLITPGMGKPPWTEDDEAKYLYLLARFEQMERASPLRKDDPDSVGMWGGFFRVLSDAQYNRLRSYLVRRRPDFMLGYSILIFRLSDPELHTALVP